MKDRLNAALSIKELGIEDDSHKHAGHAGAREGLGHFTLTIWATEFETLNTIQRHRLIYDALGEIQLDAGQTKDAIATIQTIVDLDPPNIEGYHDLLRNLKDSA